MFVRQAFHEVRHCYHTLFVRWRLTHESGSIRQETVHVHLGEVNRCVLAGAGEHDGGQKVGQLGTAREGSRDAVVCMTSFVGIAVVI